MNPIFAPFYAFYLQFKLYIILAFLAVLVLGTGTAVWKYKSAVAEE
jgi:hypothetical protein